MRAASLVFFVFLVVVLDIDIGYIGACFTLAELVVFFSQIQFITSIWRNARDSMKLISDF